MFLKRVYDRTDEENPVLDHVKVLRTSKNQKFSQNVIDQGLADGYITLSKKQIIFDTVPRVVFNIVRIPGYYCCFDNVKLGGEKEARQYIAENYPGQESPDSNNPSGYRKDNFYYCELVGEPFGKETKLTPVNPNKP